MKKITITLILGILAVLPLAAQDILTAVNNGDLTLVKELLKQNPELIRARDQYQNSLLRLALLEKDFAVAKFLIESGIDVTYGRADIGGNEISGAIQSGSLEITKLVYEKGVDIHTADRWGNTPLDGAIFGGFKEIADFLMDKGAELNIQGKGVPVLLRASLAGGLDRITKQLIEKQQVDYRNVSGLGDTFLHAVARSGETAFVDFLIGKGLNPNARNIYGWTPLHLAASEGYQAMIDVLLKNGADRDLRTIEGKTPYNIAEDRGRKDLLPYLQGKGFNQSPAIFPKLEALYIDSDLPGTKPKRFALGIVSQEVHFEHSLFSFAADMKTACWADWQREGISKIFVMEKENGLWQAPVTVQLQATAPFIAPDGKTIYFTAPRTLPDGSEARDSDIYFITKTENGWSDRLSLGPGVNTEDDEIQPTVTRDGTLYFSHKADIYRAKRENGRYGPKEKLPAPVNSEHNQVHPYISPDESFLLYRSMGPAGFREPNVFISRRTADGGWTNPVNVDQKVERIGLFPSLTPDGKFMIYFEGGDYFWFEIDAVLKELLSADADRRAEEPRSSL